MTEISDIAETVISSGILRPKFRNQFRVLVDLKDNDPEPFIQDVFSMQVVSVSNIFLIAEDDLDKEVALKYEDDIKGQATTFVLNYLKKKEFDIIIEMLDGNNGVLETIRFVNCTVQSLANNGLSYGLKMFYNSYDDDVYEFNTTRVQDMDDEVKPMRNSLEGVVRSVIANTSVTRSRKRQHQVEYVLTLAFTEVVRTV